MVMVTTDEGVRYSDGTLLQTTASLADKVLEYDSDGGHGDNNDGDVVDGGYGDNDDGSDKGGDNGYVDDGSRGDNGLFQEALINARERGFRISYSLNPC